jgi:hypothetical protein
MVRPSIGPIGTMQIKIAFLFFFNNFAYIVVLYLKNYEKDSIQFEIKKRIKNQSNEIKLKVQ